MRPLYLLAGSMLLVLFTLTTLCLTLEDPLTTRCRQVHRQVETMKPLMDSVLFDYSRQLLAQGESCRQRARKAYAEAKRLAREPYGSSGVAVEVNRLYALSRTYRYHADSLLGETQLILREIQRASPAKP